MKSLLTTPKNIKLISDQIKSLKKNRSVIILSVPFPDSFMYDLEFLHQSPAFLSLIFKSNEKFNRPYICLSSHKIFDEMDLNDNIKNFYYLDKYIKYNQKFPPPLIFVLTEYPSKINNGNHDILKFVKNSEHVKSLLDQSSENISDIIHFMKENGHSFINPLIILDSLWEYIQSIEQFVKLVNISLFLTFYPYYKLFKSQGKYQSKRISHNFYCINSFLDKYQIFAENKPQHIIDNLHNLHINI